MSAVGKAVLRLLSFFLLVASSWIAETAGPGASALGTGLSEAISSSLDAQFTSHVKLRPLDRLNHLPA